MDDLRFGTGVKSVALLDTMSQLRELCLVQFIGKYGATNYESVALGLNSHPLLVSDTFPRWSIEDCRNTFETVSTREGFKNEFAGNDGSSKNISHLIQRMCARHVAQLKDEIRCGEQLYSKYRDSVPTDSQPRRDVPSSESVEEQSPSMAVHETLPQLSVQEEPNAVVDEIATRSEIDLPEKSVQDGMVAGNPVASRARSTRTRSNTINTILSTDSNTYDDVAADQLLKKKIPRLPRRNTNRETDKSPAPSIELDDTETAATLKRFQSAIGSVVSNIASHRYASVFSTPVSDKDAPNYSNIVRSPTDLKSIKAQIKNGEISSVTSFHRAIVLMLSNAVIYNAENSEVAKMANDVFDHVEVGETPF